MHATALKPQTSAKAQEHDLEHMGNEKTHRTPGEQGRSSSGAGQGCTEAREAYQGLSGTRCRGFGGLWGQLGGSWGVLPHSQQAPCWPH